MLASVAFCTSSGMLKHHRLAIAQGAHDRALRVLARRRRRMQPLRNRADCAHHLGLLDIEIILHRAGRHVAGQHHERRPAFRRLADAGQRIGQSRAGMNADQCQLAGCLGIGVGHAGGVAFVARAIELDAILDQRVGHLEIGGAEKTKAAPRAIAGKVTPDDRSDRWIPAHCPAFEACAGLKNPRQYKAHDGIGRPMRKPRQAGINLHT